MVEKINGQYNPFLPLFLCINFILNFWTVLLINQVHANDQQVFHMLSTDTNPNTNQIKLQNEQVCMQLVPFIQLLTLIHIRS